MKPLFNIFSLRTKSNQEG